MTTEKKQFYRTVLTLVLPMAIQNLINVGVTSADVIMLGKVGETVLSASSLAGQIYFIMTLIFFGLTSGACVLAAQYWGKKDVCTIEKILGISMRIGILTGIFFTAIAQLIPETLMKIFTSDTAVIQEGVQYLRIISLSYIISGMVIVYLNIIRSVEKVVVATVVYMISLGVNIVCNAIFIFGLLGVPAMGIRGAALGTVVARIVEIILVSIYAWKYNNVVKLRFKYLFVKEKALTEDFKKYAVPVLLNELAWGAGMAMIAAIVGHLGTAAVAANSVTQVSRQLATVVSFGVAAAASIMCGKAIGEKKEEMAKTYAARFTRLSIVLGILGGCIILIISPIARHMLNLTPQAREYLKVMMVIMAFFAATQAVNCTWIVGIFRSGGDTKYGLYLDAISLWGGSIALGSICAFILKIPMPWVYIILCCDEFCKLPFAFRRYRSYCWLKNITR